MAVDHVRHGRQIRLADIGEPGQERLCASEVVLGGSGDARAIEATYLARAGIRVVDDVNAQAKAKARSALGKPELLATTLASLGIRDSFARDVADGALRALLAMRAILDAEGDGGAR